MASDLTAQTGRLRSVLEAALRKLRTRIRIYMTGHAYDLPDDADDETTTRWRSILDSDVFPELAVVLTTAAHDETQPRDLTPSESDTQDWGDAYLAAVDNRLVGVADTTWGIIRDELRTGRDKGEGIPELAKRVDGLLSDDQRWSKRAETIARTEVIGANSAGHYAAAGWTADQLGVKHSDVVKGWVDTNDARTRPTHRLAGGQHVKGLDARFRVGEALMLRPHDPAGPPDETIDCRCSMLYLMPGDTGYDAPLTAGGTMPDIYEITDADLDEWSGRLMQLVERRAVCLGMDPALAARLVRVFDVSRMPPKLKAHWLTHIAWGHPGDFKECQVALRKYLPARMVDGACANLHNEATGHYPGPGRGVSADTDPYAATPTGDAIPVQPDGTVKPEHLPAGVKPTELDPDGSDNVKGAVIVALPATDDPAQMIGPEEKHATLVYLGDAADVKASPDDIATVVEQLASGAAPQSIDVTGVESLGEEGALVWMLNPDGPLAGWHDTLKGDDTIGPLFDAVDQHPSFTAHTTIGYPTDQTDKAEDDAWPLIREEADAVKSIRFDRLGLWWGTDRREFPLSTGPMDKPTQEAPVTASSYATVSDKPWSGFTDSDYTDEQYAKACILDRGQDAGTAKQRYSIPVREPEGAVNRGGCHAAASVLGGGRGGVDATEEQKQAAASKLVSLYRSDLKEDPPESLVKVAGQGGGQAAAVSAAATDTEGEAPLATWRGPLCPEGLVTGDNRKFADGGIEWMETPGVLKAQFSDLPGHDGSVAVGLIKGVERTDGRLWAVGTWDTGEQALEARRQNKAGLMRGVSVDLDSTEFHLEDPDGNPIDGDAMFDVMFDNGPDPTVVVDKGRLRAATLCYMPAYVEAYILDDDLPDTEAPKTSIVDAPTGQDPVAVAASAGITAAATAVRQTAPISAFADPGLTEPTRLTFTDDGRFFGHLACWGVCHIGIAGACVTPPESATGYAYMLTGMYATSDGEVLPVGTLTMGTGHADLDLGWVPTVDHYDHTGTAAGYFNIGQDAHGIWIAGTVAEDLPDPMRLVMQRAGSVSGDWREIGGSLELVAALVVNVPGFPIPPVRARVASAGRALVASGIVHPSEFGLPTASGVSIATLAREVAAFQAREARTVAAEKRLRTQRSAELATRL